jgi:2-oxoglutarate ferredoxin oxidoreductase subunit gamma
MPSYGAEVRGGTSNCRIILSPEPIASPVAERFDSMLLMNQPSVLRFRDRLVRGGLALWNTTLCRESPGGRGALAIPATELAEALGDGRTANVVMLGAWAALRGVISAAAIEAGIRMFLEGKPELLDVNLRAFRTGMAHAESLTAC